MKKINSYDFFGNVVIVKFPEKMKVSEKKKLAKELMARNKSIKTVLEKIGNFKGRLRKQETKFIAGEKTKEVLYKENNCVFRFNIDTTYFSPRLSNERKEIAERIKPNEDVLVMFAGVSPFSIVIAKNSKAKKVYSNEINREANKYGKLNIELNKVKNKVELLPGDVKKVAEKICEINKNSVNIKNSEEDLLESASIIGEDMRDNFNKEKSRERLVGVAKKELRNDKISKRDFEKYSKIPAKFDVIVMPRPQLKDSFLEEAFRVSKKNTRIYYYDFCRIDEINNIVEKINLEAKKAGEKIKILNEKIAGEIAPYKVRVRIDFRIES